MNTITKHFFITTDTSAENLILAWAATYEASEAEAVSINKKERLGLDEDDFDTNEVWFLLDEDGAPTQLVTHGDRPAKWSCSNYTTTTLYNEVRRDGLV